MNLSFWLEFVLLFILSVGGGIAVLPYSLRMLDQSKPLKISRNKLLILSVVQNAILSAVTLFIGLVAARAIGLGALIKGNSNSIILIAIIWGVLAGLFLFVVDLIMFPYLPFKIKKLAHEATLWENFAASFYGGLNEEFLIRLFGLSVIAWLISLVWHTTAGMPTTGGFWIANIFMAILFGLGHLPATKKMVGEITPLLLTRALVLNGVVGIICGWLFWQHGIAAAVIAHFSADIVYHVGGTAFLQLNKKYRFVSAIL